jgi:hypothetical protein
MFDNSITHLLSNVKGARQKKCPVTNTS